MAVGYATLYGDMVGSFALLKDVYKTDVWRLARHMNEHTGREVIRVDDRAAAERRASRRPARRPVAAAVRGARPDPRGVRRARPVAEELEVQFDPAVVARTLALVDRAEAKRRQAAPG